MYDAQQVFKEAVDQLKHVEPGEDFCLKWLFRGIEWQRMSRSARLGAGILFRDYCENNDHIKILSKSSTGQQMYRLETPL